MRMVQRTLLHFAVYAALLLAVYPVIALVYTYSGLGTAHMWLSELYVILTGTAALVHAIAVKRIYRRKAVLVNISLIAAGAVFTAAAFVLSYSMGTFTAVLSALAVFAVYIAGSRLFFIEYDILSHTYVYAGICICFVLTSAVIWFGNHSASFIWQAVLLLVISGVFSLCRNFAGIDTALQSQGEESASLPKGLLRYNRLLLCVIGALVLVLVLLRKPIGSFLSYIGRTALRLLGRLYFWFAGLFTGREQESAELPESVMTPETSGYYRNDLLTLICTVLLGALSIYLVIRYRHRLAAFIAGIIPSIRRFFGRIFGRSYEKRETAESLGYTDYYSELLPEDGYTLPRDRRSFSWKREYRRFRKMEAGAEKYRLGYSLLLYKLQEEGTKLSRSATPDEILNSLPPEYPDRERVCMITRGYERVRYGDRSPEETEMTELCDMLK